MIYTIVRNEGVIALEKVYRYCPRCGDITLKDPVSFGKFGCNICKNRRLRNIDPKWNITVEKHDEIYKRVFKAGYTYQRCHDDWTAHCQPFFEQVIMKNPEYDPWYRERATELTEAYYRDLCASLLERTQIIFENKDANVPCPKCGSLNTRVNMFSDNVPKIKFFGFEKIFNKKKWHCAKCGNDF